MKPGELTALCFALSGPWSAQALGDAPALKTSPRLREEIRAVLPQFTPSPAPAAREAVVPDDPDLLKLPKLVVKEKRLPANDPDVWLTDRAIQQKSLAAYRDSMTDLEWALNKWFIPLISPPASARARQYYEGRKLRDEIDRLNNIVQTIDRTDPKEAARLRRALDPRKLPKDDD